MKYRTRLAALLKAKGLTRLDIVGQTTVPYLTMLRWETEVLDIIDPQALHVFLRLLHCTYEELVFPVEEDAPDDAPGPS